MKTSLFKTMLLLGVTIGLAQFKTLAQSTVVQTKYGSVEGLTEENIRIYKGIPFAAPPVGNLRWRPPQPPAPWTGVKKTIVIFCKPDTKKTRALSVLVCRIYRPAFTTQRRLPVFKCVDRRIVIP